MKHYEPLMTDEQLKNSSIDVFPTTLALLMRNNALLESLADLLIKIEGKDDEQYKKELNAYFAKRLEENKELAKRLLVESKDSG